MAGAVFVKSDNTCVLPREFDRPYPLIERGEGVWLYDTAGNPYLDAISGGAMVTSLGYGITEVIEAGRTQAQRIPFLYNQQFTSPAQEQLAREVVEIAPPGFTRVHFVSGGSEGNETALRLARSYHCERGDTHRTRIISPAQAYHGPTMATFSLTGRPAMVAPYEPYLTSHLHIAPSTWRFDPTGEAALAELDQRLGEAGPENVAAFFCEPISAAALPAYSPPERFWRGLDERRAEHGFLIGFDEVVTGLGRTGSWFAADQLPIEPDIIVTAKGLGAGYFPIGAVICRQEIYEAIAAGSRNFEPGHTWNGAPMPCAIGSAVIRYLREHRLIERVAERGPSFRDELAAAVEDCELVHEVRGRGFLFGVEYVDPRDGASFLHPELAVARRIDSEALDQGLLTYSTQPTADGYAGDQTLLAPAFVTSERELGMIAERFGATVRAVESWVKGQFAGSQEALAGRSRSTGVHLSLS
jgi:adenosylmethionine-8-amino-7-oxononanoate aminotransferase